MSNGEFGATLVEGVGDELIYTTLILGGVILLFNLYWIYLVAASRTIQTTVPNDLIHSTTTSATSNIATQQTQHVVHDQQPSNSDSSGEDSEDSNEDNESIDGVSSTRNEQETTINNHETEVETQTACNASTSNRDITETAGVSPQTTVQADEMSNNEKCDDVYPSPNTPQGTISSDLTIKLQFVNGLQKIVKACSEDTLGEFKRAHFNDEIIANKRVRLIMNGQELKNDTHSLKAYKICDNFVLHCLVSQQAMPTPPQNTPSQPQNTLHFSNLGSFLYICTGAIISFFWYARIFYSTFFNIASTFSLFVLSSFYLLASIAFITPNSSENRQ